MQNGDLRTRIISLHGSQTSSMDLCKQNSLFSTRITSLFGSQPSCVVLWIQKSDFLTRINCLCLVQKYQDYMGSKTRITSICEFQTPPVVFACKTANSGPEYQFSMRPRHDLSFSASTRACLASELLVSRGQNPHLRISIAKQRLLVENYKSLWAPDLTCRFVQANHRD